MITYDILSMDRQSNGWNVSSLETFFDPLTMAEILKIHVPISNIGDEFKWIHNKDGNFSVKSVYNLSQLNSFSNSLNAAPAITKIWKSNLHERSKMFLWRCISNILPIRAVLGLRFQLEDYSCILCGNSSDELYHIFLECPFVRAVWSETWDINTDQWFHLSFLDWIDQILCESLNIPQLISGTYALVSVVTMEEVWKARNQALNDIRLSPFPIMAKEIRRRCLEFTRERFNISGTNSSQPMVILPIPISTNLSSLAGGTIRIFFDAAIRVEGSYSAGVVLGSFGEILSMSTAFHPSICVESAEARAAYISLKAAWYMRNSSLVLAGDNQSIINQIKSAKSSSWSSSSIIKDIVDLLPSFANLRCIKINRQNNLVAHELAKWAATCKYSGVLPVNSFPVSVTSLV